MTAMPMTAREALTDIFSNPQPIVKKAMDETMQELLAMCDTNEKRAALWSRNPLTGAVVKERYNDRF